MAYFSDYPDRRLIRVTISRLLLIYIITNIASCSGKPVSPYQQWRGPRFYDTDEEFEDPDKVSIYHHQFYHNYQDINFPNFDQDKNVEQQTEKIFKASTKQETTKTENFEKFIQIALENSDEIDRLMTKKSTIEMTSTEIPKIKIGPDNDIIMIHAKNALSRLIQIKVAIILDSLTNTNKISNEDIKILDKCTENIQRVTKDPSTELLYRECAFMILDDQIRLGVFNGVTVKLQDQQAKEFADKMTKINVTRLEADLRIFQANISRRFFESLFELYFKSHKYLTTKEMLILQNCYNSIDSFLNNLSFDLKPDCIDVTAMMNEDKYQIGVTITTEGIAVDELEMTETVSDTIEEQTTINELETTQLNAESSEGVDTNEELTSTETTIIIELETTQQDAEPSEGVNPTETAMVDELDIQPDAEPSEGIDTVEVPTSTETTMVDELGTTDPDIEPLEEVDTVEELDPIETTMVIELETTQQDVKPSEGVDPTETTMLDELVIIQPDVELPGVDTVEVLTSTETTMVDELETTDPEIELLEEVYTVEESTPTETTMVDELETTQQDVKPLEGVDPTETTMLDELEMIQPDIELPEEVYTVEESTPTETTMVDELETTQPDVESLGVDINRDIIPTSTHIVDELETTQHDTETLEGVNSMYFVEPTTVDVENDIHKAVDDILIALEDKINLNKISINEGQIKEVTNTEEENSRNLDQTLGLFAHLSGDNNMLKSIGSNDTTNRLSSKIRTIEDANIVNNRKLIKLLLSEDDGTTISHFENNNEIKIGPSTTLGSIDNFQLSTPVDDANKRYDISTVDKFQVKFVRK